MPSPYGAAAVAGLSALYKVGTGIHNLEDATQRSARNRRPPYNIQDEYYNDQSIAQNQAGQGFSSKTVDNYDTQTERGLQATIDAALQGGGGPNAVQNALSNYNLSNRNFAAADSEKETQNLNSLIERNKELASQKTMKWTIDKYKPFLDEASAINQERTAGKLNLNTAFGEGTAIASSLYSAGVNADLLKVAKTPAVDYFAALTKATPSTTSVDDYQTFEQKQMAKKDAGGNDSPPADGTADTYELTDADKELLTKLLQKKRIQ